jgi:hypothetical protein
VAGVQKGGTTSLNKYLVRHKEVCEAELLEGFHELSYWTKEVHFFDHKERLKLGLDFYSHHFDHCEPNVPFILDSTPDYMRRPENIHQGYEEHGTIDELKVIFSLRNPVARQASIYNHMAADSYQDNPPQWAKDALWLEEEGRIMTFEEYIQPILKNPELHASKDMYHDLLVRWTNLFDRQQILVLSFDELVVNSSTALQRVHSFLNLPVNEPEDLQLPHSNSKSSHEKHELDSAYIPCEIQEQLLATFAPYNEKLYTFLEEYPGNELEQHPFPKFDNTCNPTLKVFLPIYN